jgi:hypothetical protein
VLASPNHTNIASIYGMEESGGVRALVMELAEGPARTDIFALGAVLYEMVTGRRAFQGSSQASLIGAITTEDPPSVATLQPVALAALDQLIRRCPAKSPDDRWLSPGDLAFQIRWIAESGVQPGPATTLPANRGSRERWAWLLATVCLLLAIDGAVAYFRREPPAEPRILRFNVPLPPGTSLTPARRSRQNVNLFLREPLGNLGSLGKKKFRAPKIQGRQFVGFYEPANILTGLLPVNSLDPFLQSFETPGSICLNIPSDPGPHLIQSRGQQRVICRSPTCRVPDEVVPIPPLQIFAA